VALQKKILIDWPIYSKLAPYLKVLELDHTVKIDFPGVIALMIIQAKLDFVLLQFHLVIVLEV
jgi:hypothetical protein